MQKLNRYGMFLRPAWLLAVSMLIAFAASLFAQATEDYFTGVALQTGNKSEAVLISEALANVLGKLTGSQAPAADPRLQAMIADAGNLLTGFSYREVRAPGNVFDDPDRYLQASFERRTVLERLRQLQVPLWNLERPDLLLWLAIEDETGARRMLGGDEDSLRFLLARQARYRGLPLLLPLQDQTDYTLMQPESIWGGFHEDALLASERYGADQTLIATATPAMLGQRPGWEARWRLLNDQGLEVFTSAGMDLPSALLAGIDQLAVLSASQGSIRQFSATTQEAIVTLPRITGPEDIGRAWRALSGFSQIEAIALQSAGKNAIRLRLQMRAGRDWLARAIGLSDELRLAEQGSEETGFSAGGATSLARQVQIPVILSEDQ